MSGPLNCAPFHSTPLACLTGASGGASRDKKPRTGRIPDITLGVGAHEESEVGGSGWEGGR